MGCRLDKRFQIPVSLHDTEDEDILALDAIDNDIVSDRETTQARPQFLISTTSDVRILGQRLLSKPVSHQRGVVFCGSILSRPRCFTFPASSCMACCVIS